MRKFILSAFAAAMLSTSPALAQAVQVKFTGSWANPATGTAATGTRMEMSTDGSTWSTACTASTATATTCEAAPVAIGPVYQFRFVRFNAFGNSTPSQVVQVGTTPPNTPTSGVVTFSVVP